MPLNTNASHCIETSQLIFWANQLTDFNICVGVSIPKQVFSCEIREICKNMIFYKTPQVAVFLIYFEN